MGMAAAAIAVLIYGLYAEKRNRILSGILLVLDCIGWFYFFHPPINVHSFRFWLFAWLMIFTGLTLFRKEPLIGAKESGKRRGNYQEEGLSEPLYSDLKHFFIALAGFAICWALVDLFCSPLFRSHAYAERISVDSVSFSEIPSFNFSETAVIDQESAQLVGDKVMGEMTDLVSQFNVSSEYSQISYEGGTYRVTPLAYSGLIIYFRNASEGVPGYILVNTTTGNARLQRLSQKMKYVPSAYFNDNLYRPLRFAYPTVLFGSPTFEIDDGNPYYVCTAYTFAGFTAMKKVTGVILYDPTDGSSERYDLSEVPSWVDRVFPESLISKELNDRISAAASQRISIIG